VKRAKRKTAERLGASIFNVPAMLAPHSRLRVFFHKLRGVRIGKNVEIGYHVLIDNLYPEKVIIEDNVTITARCTILAHDESFAYTRGGEELVRETRICENAFIGVHSVILCGVRVGKRAIVGAGSVVTKDVEDDAIVTGIPAKKAAPNTR
jgi:acetyltransferase-like isoleucine patch superfamily enzyme